MRAVRGSIDKGSTIHEHRRSLVLPRTREDTPITMEATLTLEEVLINTMDQRVGMGMERAAIRAALT